MGRPLKPIDPEQVHRLAAIHCTVEEIASVLDCGKRTLERRFGAVIEKARQTGKASLRRRQYKAAMDGNITMMIWLGKQLLGQTDRVEQLGDQAVQVSVRYVDRPPAPVPSKE